MFISKDPIGFRGGINLYSYVDNNPVNWIDPWGLRGGSSGRKWSGNIKYILQHYYKEWGGPSHSGGYDVPYDMLTNKQLQNLKPPADRQDHFYMIHDKCYASCRKRFKNCPYKLKVCYKYCDRIAAGNLYSMRNDPSYNMRARTSMYYFRSSYFWIRD
ncbi:RHS repeat-associated core domain-containing protein [Chlamydiota bacterium]